MSDFAKLVRASDGAQVLFLKDQSVDGRPTLYRYTEFEGITAKLGLSYADTDSGYEHLDKAFNEMGVADADAFRDKIKDVMGV